MDRSTKEKLVKNNEQKEKKEEIKKYEATVKKKKKIHIHTGKYKKR